MMTDAEITVDTMIELISACQNGTVSITSPTFCQNCPPGSRGGQVCASAVLSLDPMMNDQ